MYETRRLDLDVKERQSQQTVENMIPKLRALRARNLGIEETGKNKVLRSVSKKRLRYEVLAAFGW